MLGAAKTGSGKTLAFLVPLVEKLYRSRITFGCGNQFSFSSILLPLVSVVVVVGGGAAVVVAVVAVAVDVVAVVFFFLVFVCC